MSAPRNLTAALATVRQAARQETRGAVTLRALSARARLLDAETLKRINADEFRELLELALQPRATIPAGAAGESVLAYLLALRSGRNPVAAARDALLRFDAKGEVGIVADWMSEAAKRDAARADALRAEAVARFGEEASHEAAK